MGRRCVTAAEREMDQNDVKDHCFASKKKIHTNKEQKESFMVQALPLLVIPCTSKASMDSWL
jgi:hypothetical protein